MELDLQYRNLFSLSQDLIAIAGIDGYFKQINNRWTELLGYSREELLNHPFISLIHPEDQRKTALITKKKAQGNVISRFENRFITKDGQTIWLEWNTTDVEDDTHEFFAIVRDKTIDKKQKLKLRKMLKQLRVKTKQLESYAYITSHNLKSPVANIFTLTNFLEETTTNQEQDEYISRIKISTEILNKTIDDLVRVIQINSFPELKIRSISLKKTCKEVSELLHDKLTKYHINLTYDFEQGNYIQYSKAYLHNIFFNLISNSITYRSSERPATIHIESRKVNNTIQLLFSDNGIGIDLKKHRNNIFGFGKTFHNNPEAKGFGLFLIKSQIEALNGNISIASEVNKGTTFIINLA
ncbi:PAS domain S-box protein [Aquimarina hainanensis]|uniref:histidine kinase n=1 Tax=Aquimarina hainanensis TaxID=1578017 RepID=A0ABW5N8C6_9FLAO|nr:PAS domain-containing sensor histidine kinase [Aquimarina sp. TRL1]QKX05706.1 PAS domain-containing sensor histidine kinase [Aquimarina sp. TRL1]